MIGCLLDWDAGTGLGFELGIPQIAQSLLLSAPLLLDAAWQVPFTEYSQEGTATLRSAATTAPFLLWTQEFACQSAELLARGLVAEEWLVETTLGTPRAGSPPGR